MTKYVKLLIIVFTIILSGYFSYQNILMVQKVGDVVKVDGIMNIGSTYGVFFVALASLSGSLALIFNLPLPILNENLSYLF
ncbi:hypothetical protein BCT76_13175 [Vibrio tasmaniensis]|nr:hypothetical protein A152_17165 [Vibrio tasmaniensis 1F-187]PML13526.1 hypothetical protein BCT83_18875 [Vibrio tasmaniensis]PML46860.1 hypothetical protein BCT76_13175 [Vibrio tasmaniensis]